MTNYVIVLSAKQDVITYQWQFVETSLPPPNFAHWLLTWYYNLFSGSASFVVAHDLYFNHISYTRMHGILSRHILELIKHIITWIFKVLHLFMV